MSTIDRVSLNLYDLTRIYHYSIESELEARFANTYPPFDSTIHVPRDWDELSIDSQDKDDALERVFITEVYRNQYGKRWVVHGDEWDAYHGCGDRKDTPKSEDDNTSRTATERNSEHGHENEHEHEANINETIEDRFFQRAGVAGQHKRKSQNLNDEPTETKDRPAKRRCSGVADSQDACPHIVGQGDDDIGDIN